MAALAGARRTDTAGPRLWEHAAVPDVDVTGYSAGLDVITAERLARIPQVRDVSHLDGFLLALLPESGPVPDRFLVEEGVALLASVDGNFGRSLGRFDRVPGFEGRLARPDRVEEVLLNTTAARRLGARIGSVVHAGVGSVDEEFAGSGIRPVDLVVTGIVTYPNEHLGKQRS